MKITDQELVNGKKIPFGYGTSHRDVMTQSIIVYPIPFNLMVRGCRRIQLFIIEINSRNKVELLQARQLGFIEGWNARQKLMEEQLDKLALERRHGQ